MTDPCNALSPRLQPPAAPAQPGPIPSFDELDANNDGYVTLPESGVDTRISRNFNAADRDGDYRLNRERIGKRRARRPDRSVPL